MTRLAQKKAVLLRARGVKPKDPDDRAACVQAAVRTLQKIGATFTVADVAERAGVSRATIYRSPSLRALIGAKGDGPRTVEADLHDKLCARHEATKAKARDLRRRLADSEASWDEMRERALQAESQVVEFQRRLRTLELQLAEQKSGSPPLAAAASRLGPEAVRRARRQLARALHPDLFAQDPPVALLATELLKAINSLTE